MSVSDRDSLGDRMKRYEHAFRSVLPQRLPIIVRVDGKAFHTVLADAERPWDPYVREAMDDVARALCEEIQGAQLAYVQSDEVNVLVHGYKRHASQAWFDGEVQKIASVSASVATVSFNTSSSGTKTWKLPGLFDSRAFVLPEADVCNYFIWRQQDAARNSVQMLARSFFSHSQCEDKTCAELQEMLFAHRGINWNDSPTWAKRGRCAVRGSYTHEGAVRYKWVIDSEVPTFSADRQYVERFLAIEPESDR